MLQYPAEFPSDAADSLAKILLSLSIKSNVAQFALDVWTLQGYVQSKTFGTPTDQIPQPSVTAFTSEPPISREEAVERLKAAADMGRFGEREGVAQSFNWSSLIPVVRFALQELLTLLPTS